MATIEPIIKWTASPVFEFLAAMFRITSHEKLLQKGQREVPGKPIDLTRWVEQKRAVLPKKLKDRLELFFNVESFFAMTLVRFAWDQHVYTDIDRFIAALQKLPSNDLLAHFLNSGYNDDQSVNMDDEHDVASSIDRSNLTKEEKWKLLYLYMHKERTKQQLIELFQTIYPYIKDDLIGFMERQRNSLEKMQTIARIRGMDAFLKMMSGLSKMPLREMNEIVFVPSVLYDDLSLTSQKDATLIFLYGVKSPSLETDYSSDSDKALQAIKILTDEKRIRIIRLLNQGPLYGYELGQRMNLSNSTISHHLSALASAHLVKPVRRENRVYYQVQRSEIEKLLNQVKAMLIGGTS